VNARQLVTRARRGLRGDHRRPVDATQQQCVLDAFIIAAQAGDLTTLEQLLIADVPGRDAGASWVRVAA
jgi:RNA polymerase sigma-70 factor, ECF subfamily